jgi:hypothetical protein
MHPRSIGIINGLVFLLFWSFVAMLSAPVWYGVLAPIMFILVPSSVLVAWRGNHLSNKFISNSARLSHSIIDGFKWGFIAAATFMAWSISAQVFAAGGHFDNSDFFSMQTAKYIVAYAIPVSFVGGVTGALHGAVFFYLNRWLYTANKARQNRPAGWTR